jgi:CRISPR-associated protein Csx3
MVYNPLPAVVLGGPPHRGKSVLAYSLTRALRTHAVRHYLLRAYPPDGEGDWFHEGEQDVVRHLRIKGARSEGWLPLLRRDIARRHLPLIVDMGGLPTPEQEAILETVPTGSC